MALQIALDASRATRARRTGTENYAYRILRGLLALPTAHRYRLYFRDAPGEIFAPLPPNAYLRVIPFRRAWTHVRFAGALFADRPDVTFVPSHTLPLIFPGKAVVTVHDLGYLHFPDAHPHAIRRYLDLTTRYSARRATQVIAISAATRDDLMRYYGVPAQKITVIHHGVEPMQRPAPDIIETARAKYRLPARYFLFVSTLQPRKNITRLTEAFARFLETDMDSAGDTHLVLAGSSGWLFDLQRDVLSRLPESAAGRIVTPGYIADEDLPALYGGALAFTFPSLYEGFGLPVLEAMQCGTPVLCANTSSLPELAGDAALRVDPLDVAAIAAGMARLASDSALRADLSERGRVRAAGFTWERAARATLAVLEAVGGA